MRSCHHLDRRLACRSHGDELYVLLEGRGRVRVDAELLTLDPLSALYAEADTVRQISTTPATMSCGSSWARRPRRPTHSR